MRHTDEAPRTMASAQDEGRPQLRTDAWSRAARQVRERASFLGLTLDETGLAFQDVRDLQATYAAQLRCKPRAPRRIRHLQREPGIDGRRARPNWATGLALLVLGSSALVAGGAATATGGRAASGSHLAAGASTHMGEYLYVWTGDARREAPDRLVAIDYDAHSPRYGTVVGAAEVPGPGGIDNEPHHCGLSADQHILACGGLLSVLRHQDGIFFFDVSQPDAPRFLSSAGTLHSSITDDFIPLPNGGFLVTMMGSASGGSPGRVAEFDGRLHLVHEWPDWPPTDGFNPHGMVVRPDRNLMITCDFVDPASTLNAVPGGPVFRGSVRVWDLQRRAIVRTVRTVRIPAPWIAG